MSSSKGNRGKLASAAAKSALVLGASLSMFSFSGVAVAQDTSAEEEEEAIVVTGTRITQRDFQTASPIATVGAEEIALTGTVNVEELINSLPQVVPGLTVTSNNPSLNGFATADLRGLGPGRTLILINGRRANPSDRQGLVDLNTIPAALLERVELITGGASAVYGADAVAGAINFILKDDFEGIETNMSYGATEDGLAPEWAFDVTLGTPFANDRGHITGFVGYYSRASVGADERDWTDARGAVLDPSGNAVVVDPGFVPPASWPCALSPTVNGCALSSGGSATAPWATVTGGFSVGNIATITGLTLDADCNPANGIQTTGGSIRFNAAGGIEPFQNCALDPNGNSPTAVNRGDRYNFAPDNFLILENERINAAMFAEYDLSENITTFVEMTATNSRSQQQLAATPVTGLTVRVDLDPTAGVAINPYVQANTQLFNLLNLQFAGTTAPANFNHLNGRTLGMSIRPNQGGLRIGTAETNALGFTGGFRGTLGESELDWETFASYARNQTNIIAENNVGATAMRQLINACGVTSNAVQAAPLTALPDCPFPNRLGSTFTPTGNSNNPLGLNSMNAAQLAFINVDTTDVITYERSIIGAYVSGDLWDLWGAGPLSFAAGGEYRQEQLNSKVDPFKAAGDIFGFNAQESISGRYDVYEFYGEFSLPIVSELPFAHYLGFEGGYRFSDYSTGAGRTDTYKAGLTYSPVEWLTFRGIYNRAVRAPTAFELFQAGDQNFPGYADPCNNATVAALAGTVQTDRINACTAWFAAGGAAYVFPSAFAQANNQVEAFQVGTPNLQPETADSYTYGVVFNPDWFPVGNLAMSVDVYSIDIQDTIALRGIANILTGCLLQAGAGADCALAPRQADGQIDFVNQTRSNVPGHQELRGIDYNIRWAYDLEEVGLTGEFGIATLVSFWDRFDASGTSNFNVVGLHDGTIGGGIPEWRGVTSFSYETDKLSMLLRWSYTDQLALNTGFAPGVDEYSLWSAGARYDVNERVALSLSVDNLLDEEPPVFLDAQAFGQFNTDGSTYDQLGRSFRVGLTLRN
ncbi:MAG: TonB-dependent receptor [Hyphomonadaceae bacterium]|nr:TonB-dependent receptor [Hyphomonadaceae bacterium]